MDNLKTITGMVKHVLVENQEARNSDYELYYQVCKMINPVVLGMNFGLVIRNKNDFGLPSIESVGRARRKLVETYPELAGCSDVEAQRLLNEEAFKEYAKGVAV